MLLENLKVCFSFSFRKLFNNEWKIYIRFRSSIHSFKVIFALYSLKTISIKNAFTRMIYYILLAYSINISFVLSSCFILALVKAVSMFWIVSWIIDINGIDVTATTSNVKTGETVQITCRVIGQPNTFIYEWRKDGKPLLNTKSDLTIESPAKSHSGFYECIATNHFGTVSSGVSITVFGKCRKTIVNGQTEHVNSSLSLTCLLIRIYYLKTLFAINLKLKLSKDKVGQMIVDFGASRYAQGPQI